VLSTPLEGATASSPYLKKVLKTKKYEIYLVVALDHCKLKINLKHPPKTYMSDHEPMPRGREQRQ
jgi:hypothetical protein